MKTREGEQEIGGGLTGVGRFFTDECGCGSALAYGVCCGAEEGDRFIDFCTSLSLERDIALEVGQLAWRIARETPTSRWFARAYELTEELFGDDDVSKSKLLQLVTMLLEAHQIAFPGVDGSGARPS